MQFQVDVTRWWASFREEPDIYREHPAYDGRDLTLEGRISVGDHYDHEHETRFHGGICRLYIRPVDKGSEAAPETAQWWQDDSKTWWLLLNVNLKRPLWEDLWARTYHPRPNISIQASMTPADGLPKAAMGHAGISDIAISG